MKAFLHITKHKEICSLILSEDDKAKYVIKQESSKEYTDPYEYALRSLYKWQPELLDKKFTRIILMSDKRNIASHTTKCEKRKNVSKLYDFEEELRGKFKIELLVANTDNYSYAKKNCKNENIEEKEEVALETVDDTIEFM